MPISGVLLSTLPVVAFLTLLVLMDSFKLVARRAVVRSLFVGALAAFAALHLNTWILDRSDAPILVFRRYIAPILEEAAKSLWIVWLVRSRRTGFMVDAAIHGFAVGTGFALVENVHYLRTLQSASVPLWIVRGFGTAVIHGSTTAIFATVAKSLSDRRPAGSFALFLPPFALAVVIHSLFNHFVLPPLAMTALLLVVMPLLFVLVFEHSEKATRNWLGTSFDSRLELLDLILSGDVRETRVGSYLQEVRDRFPPAVLADMLCYLRVHLELSMRAKAQLIAREAGAKLAVGQEVLESLKELEYLEGSLGRTGRLAMAPFLAGNPRDLWELRLLRE
jgi:RsiW-degrading membrane proteinase PrsW (M82 family)